MKVVREKGQITSKRKSIGMTPDFLTEILKTRMAWGEKCLLISKRPRLSTQHNTIKIRGEIKFSTIKQITEIYDH